MGEERWMRVCTETLDWALREMCGPEGGFYSALDADSEGEEGRFYVWEEPEMREALSDSGIAADAIERVLGYWGVSGAGNFEGKNILHVPLGASAKQPAELADARTALYAWRDRRVRPGLDDKRLLSWNALMIAALADAGAALGRPEHIDAASACARFIWESMRDSRVACSAPGRVARRASTHISRTTPICSKACCASMRRRSRSAGSTLHAKQPTR
jgi:uncharacterized protein YyaL (SSP411 family)